MSLLERFTQPGEAQIPTVSHQGDIPSGQPTCTITIDGREVPAVVGEAILRAAQRAGFNIPTLCDDEKLAPAAACRMCLVNVEGHDRPLPSCHLPVEPGMKITATNDELFAFRKQNLEYILSDHNAYCMPPCQVGCPTHIDIPGFLELMTKGQHVEAARLLKETLPFPYALGLVCPAPCQEVCRRGLVEEEIAIRQCHGYFGELSLEMEKAPTPFPQEAATGKRVAVVGALTVRDNDEIMLITFKGQMVRISVNGIREAGRNTQGVKLVGLDSGDKLQAVAPVIGEAQEDAAGNDAPKK